MGRLGAVGDDLATVAARALAFLVPADRSAAIGAGCQKGYAVVVSGTADGSRSYSQPLRQEFAPPCVLRMSRGNAVVITCCGVVLYLGLGSAR